MRRDEVWRRDNRIWGALQPQMQPTGSSTSKGQFLKGTVEPAHAVVKGATRTPNGVDVFSKIQPTVLEFHQMDHDPQRLAVMISLTLMSHK